LARNPEFRQRFEREARAVSSLNHPHICTLHDIGQQDGVDYLVMEYLEGETLSARLGKGPLASAQAIEYAIQIADALAQAHRQDVYHRDLKPGNIMLTKTGAKLLDFFRGETGRNEVYALPVSGPRRNVQFSTEGGDEPVWAPSGKELFYRNEDRMMAVAIETRPEFRAGKPALLFEGRYERSPWFFLPNYDVTRDGQRFLMVQGAEQATNQLNVVLNWFEDLKRRAASGR